MNILVRAAAAYSQRARDRRAEVFRQQFIVDANTKVLDLGSEAGHHIRNVLRQSNIESKNVYIADIDPAAVAEGNRLYGFTPVVIDESGALPFPDKFFDVVHCSSVIEHVTVPKSRVWTLHSGEEFRRLSNEAQSNVAREIERVGKQYFVQTPNKWFPIESHSWLPFIGWLPRPLLIRVLRLTNKFWVKKTSPDWNLLDASALARLFEDATVISERSLGMVKSVTALKSVQLNQALMG
jgi:SAM-dependent methyltransferase